MIIEVFWKDIFYGIKKVKYILFLNFLRVFFKKREVVLIGSNNLEVIIVM